MHFRAVSREEIAEPYAAIWNMEYPTDRRSRDESFGSFVILPKDTFEEHWVDDDVRATVSAYNMKGPGAIDNLQVDIAVVPEFESKASSAIDKVEEIAERANPKSTSIWCSDQKPERVTLLEKRGYGLIQTAPVTRLDVANFDITRFAPKVDAVQKSGIQILTVAELEATGVDWVPNLLEATWEMAQDMPHTHDPVQPKLDQYREMLENETIYKKDLMFIAMDGERIVGYSRVTPGEAMPELVRTGLSGTVRSHRRRGIVTAMKATQIETLRQRGILFAQTDNDERNPMYQLNLDLGFQNVWHWMQFEKHT